MSLSSRAAFTTLLVVRHGEVAGLNPERFRGRADLPLTEFGLRQAEAVASRISSAGRPASVFSSPLERTMTTGKAIGRAIRRDVVPVAGLIDLDYGQWEGLTREAARERWPEAIDAWYRDPDLAAIPGGETLADVLARTTRSIGTILTDFAGETIVIVGHSAVNRVVLLHALGLPLGAFWRIAQDPCGLSELRFDAEHRFVVQTMNETQHLAKLQR